jgi:hypothetical protein
MAAADLPMALMGVSDPGSWSGTDWASDVVPHLAYGLVTYGIITAAQRRPAAPGDAAKGLNG